jgi:hypothetical protein
MTTTLNLSDLLSEVTVPSTQETIVSEKDPKYALMDIGPAEAQALLDRNTHNRNLRFRVVNSYTADMIAGKWRAQNGESIKIATDGTIIDGQHRLHAIIKSGVTLRLLVVSDLSMDVQESVDTGVKRAFADSLKLRGETQWNTLSAITRRVEIWEQGGRQIKGGNIQPSISQLFARLEKNPELRDASALGQHVKAHVRIPVTLIGFAHWLFNQIETETPEERAQLEEDIKTFFERLRDGANLPADHPIAVLRRTANDNNASRSRLREDIFTAIFIKAWNAYREGRAISMLRYRPGGAHPEAFPEPV